jgi:hypothetical protein
LLSLSCFIFGLGHFSKVDAVPLEKVPPPLEPWVDWVLHDVKHYTCPFHFNQSSSKAIKKRAVNCQWPSRLTVNVNGKQADFSQEWLMYSSGWITLPGNLKYWPQNVLINDNSAIVVDRGGVPSLFAPQGQVLIKGQFQWEQRPEFLQVPLNTGLVALTIDKTSVAIPELDTQGRLWLQRGITTDQVAEDNRLDIKVYRQIIDEIPLQLITHIELDVAGRHREVLLGPVMLDKHIAMSLESKSSLSVEAGLERKPSLPVRLETDGRLRVQVRPGSWTLTLRTRQPGPVAQLALVPSEEQWVSEEIWVFKARHDLRLVEVRGVTAIDPQQTALPSNWRKFPAYQVRAGETLELVEKRRGDPEPSPDQLHLQRHFWLDFDGNGYSVQDHITGTMTRGWRLEMTKPAILGRVAINGQDQFITRLDANSNAGIEVRRGHIDLIADSRLENTVVQLPAVGWAHDFQQVSATLHLPPGWRLLNAVGVDNVPQTWLKQWTLLDLFIVLIMAAAVSKLWHWRWGGLTLVTMSLLSHETGAPYWVWLNIIAALALLRVLPELGWFSRLVRGYRNLSILTLLIIALPFMMQQARQSIYPQLEYPWKQLDRAHSNFMPAHVYPIPELFEEKTESWEAEEQAVQLGQTKKTLKQMVPATPNESLYTQTRSSLKPYAKLKRQQLLQIDPNAQVQTGPGLPQWEWPGSISMGWSGPVQQTQTINLWLLSPTANSVIGWLRIVLLGSLTLFFLWASWGSGARSGQAKSNFSLFKQSVNAVSVLLVFWFVGLLFLPTASYAQEAQTGSFTEIIDHSGVQTTVNLLDKAGVPGVNLLKQDKAEPAVLINDFPPPALLDELQKRLLAPPDCLPTCVSSPRLLLDLNADQLRARMEVHSQTDVMIPLPGVAKQWLPQQVWLNGELAQGLLRRHGHLWLSIPTGIHQVQLAGPLPNRAMVQLPLPLKSHFVNVTDAKGWRVDGLHENGVADNQLQFTREQTEETQLADLEMGSLPPFVQIERTLLLGLDWQVETQVVRKTPLGSAIVLEIPLLNGESVTSDQIRVVNGKALINLSPYESQIGWNSVFDKQETLILTASENTFSSEIWRLDASAIWHVEIEGISVVHHQAQGRWLPEWQPWPGETVTLHLSRPTGMTGQVLTIDRSHLKVKPGQRTTDNHLSLNIRSSRGMQHQITLPRGAQLQSVSINHQSQPIRQEGRIVTLPITPGAQSVEVQFQQPVGMDASFDSSSVDLGLDSVNTVIEIDMPSDRWILFAGGSPIGPAVMIWGILIVIALMAFGLGQISLTPLNTFHWLLLGIVLSQVPVPAMLCVIAWFFALGLRANLATENWSTWKFNLMQMGLGILTFIALGTLLGAIQQGLLGHPDMHIAGNGSDASLLRWYEDRTTGTLPSVWVFSLSLWFYRIAMLLWALWISFALLRWLRWGWECFSHHELWKPRQTPKAVKTKT